MLAATAGSAAGGGLSIATDWPLPDYGRTCVGSTVEIKVLAALTQGGQGRPIPAMGWEITKAEAELGFVDQAAIVIGSGSGGDPDEPSDFYVVPYEARRWGQDTLLLEVKMKPEFGSSLSDKAWLPIEVVPCVNGRWQEGSRTIEIEQNGDQVIAYVVNGSFSCYEGKSAKDEVDFTARIKKDGSYLKGSEATGLQVCNPPDCVGTNGITRTERRPFDARLSRDGKSLKVIWDKRNFDGDCNESGIEAVPEVWTRILPFPDEHPKPWPSMLP